MSTSVTDTSGSVSERAAAAKSAAATMLVTHHSDMPDRANFQHTFGVAKFAMDVMRGCGVVTLRRPS